MNLTLDPNAARQPDPRLSKAKPLHRVVALTRHEVAGLSGDPSPLITLLIAPLLSIGFAVPIFGPLLRSSGFPHATGAQQAVPGLSLLFCLFVGPLLGISIMNEFMWNTWNRLRASGASPVKTLFGKAGPWLGLGVFQQAFIVGIGYLAFHFSITGSVTGYALIAAAFVCFSIALGAFLGAYCTTWQQLNAFSSMGILTIAGLGGALTPIATLPAVIRAIAPISPVYWAMSGYRSIVLSRASAERAAVPCVVLLAFTLVLVIAAATKLRRGSQKDL